MTTPSIPPQRAQERPRSTRRALASIVLGFELIVVFLGGLTIFGLNALEPRELGIFIGLALAALMILGLALMRTPLGIPIGWAAQVGMLATGFILPALFIAAGLFAGLWIYCIIVGGRMDAARAQEGDLSSNVPGRETNRQE